MKIQCNLVIPAPSGPDRYQIVRYSILSDSTYCHWLRCCATNWKVVGLIPDGVIGIFH